MGSRYTTRIIIPALAGPLLLAFPAKIANHAFRVGLASSFNLSSSLVAKRIKSNDQWTLVRTGPDSNESQTAGMFAIPGEQLELWPNSRYSTLSKYKVLDLGAQPDSSSHTVEIRYFRRY